MNSNVSPPIINFLGSGQINPIAEGIFPNITAGEVSDCTFSGKVTIEGTNSKSLLIHNCNIADVELRIEGSYDKIAFVNCNFDKKSVVTIYENSKNPSREILLMGCDYSSDESELLILENENKSLDWKTENLWIYDNTIPEDELKVIRSYLAGEIEEEFDDEFDVYTLDDLNMNDLNMSDFSYEREEDSIGWKVPLVSLGIAALLGLTSTTTRQRFNNKDKVEKNEYIRTEF